MTAAPHLSTASDGCPLRAITRRLVAVGILLAVAAAMIGRLAGEHLASVTIVYIHVPAACLSLILYAVAVAAAAGTLQGLGPAPAVLAAIAPVGAAAALAGLWTGLMSHEARAAWWALDAYLVGELVLLLLFAGMIALQRSADEPGRAERAGAVLVLTGALNAPIIYFWADWWHTVHGRAVPTVARSPLVTGAMALVTLAFCMLAGALVLARMEPFTRCVKPARGNSDRHARRAGAPTPAKEQQ